MATASSPLTYKTKSSRLLKAAFYLLAFLIVVFTLIALYAYRTARSALPQLDGSIRISGLSAPVSVIRDEHGVPTIQAASLEDLFIAQGYVTAQDRLWQMDVMRRFAAGELAEVLGTDLIEHDREQRILGMRQAARKSVELASAQDRRYFEAYAKGVNALIDSHPHSLPIEFRILGYKPRPWAPEDSTLIAAHMVKDLNHYLYRHALEKEKILAKLGPGLTADLYVNSSWHDRPPTVMRPGFTPEKNTEPEDDEEGVEDGKSIAGLIPKLSVEDFETPVLGSNNWVISGAHTTTGKPLLANDMHLGHQMPNLWYEAHLRSGSFDVAGVTLPGLPYVIVGHNQRIAWGFTNVGPAVEEVYVEKFNSSGEYQTGQGWSKADNRHEIIHVKGKPDIAIDVTVTRHGPIITQLVPGETRPIALRWTLYDGTHNPFLAVNSAQNWSEFRTAFSQLDCPGQNVVYADVDGNIGYQTTGKIPIREYGDGSLPADGSDDSHEWSGYIPFAQLPSVLNPPSGVIATANSRITADGYPYSISFNWEAPWRSARIYRVLESGKKFSTADMLSLQMDIFSEADHIFADRLVYAVDHAGKASVRAKQAADIMRGWDGRMSAGSAAPTLATQARRELMRLLLEPKLGAAAAGPGLSWRTYRSGMDTIWLENVVLHHPKRWLPESYSSYDELLTAAVAVAAESNQAPKNLSIWSWGNYHPLEIQHPILGKLPFISRWSGPGVLPQSGSGLTVKAVSRSHGPSERFTADLSDPDKSTLNVVTGQGGNFLSPFYMDQWKAWYQGSTFQLPYSAQAVSAAKKHRLTLNP
jgi:penicillin G amidase